MNNAKLTHSRKKAKKVLYNSPLREEQSKLTQMKIQNAVFDLFHEVEGIENITYKAVAKRASVTEMTVFRHFPERSLLLKILWEKINAALGPNIKMPENAKDLVLRNNDLHLGFDRNPQLIKASITTPQGREMRNSLNKVRQDSFLKIVDELNGDLDDKVRRYFASVLQLLHSAYAWDSMKEQWDMSGSEVGEATTKAIQIIINEIKKGKSK